MRTIKFRGKTLDKKEWVFGFYACLSNEFKKWHCIMTEKDSSSNYIKDCNGYDMIYTPVTPDTIGQFTGLCDKNGKEIYEGDIVEYYELCTYCINPDCEPHLICYGDSLCKKTSEVEFTDGSFEIYYCGLHKECLDELKEREERGAYFETNGYEINDSIIGIKVIGNIHDNPGLINK